MTIYIGTVVLFTLADTSPAINGERTFPAIITQRFEGSTNSNMTVFLPSGETPAVARFSVPHISEAVEGDAFWAQPVSIDVTPGELCANFGESEAVDLGLEGDNPEPEGDPAESYTGSPGE